MGFEELFNETKIKKVEKSEFEIGKTNCCKAVCKTISNGIEAYTNEIDEVLYEGYLTKQTKPVKDKIINDAKVSIKTLNALRDKIMKREPNCKCY